MKVALTFAALLALCACQKKAPPPAPPANPQAAASAAAPNPASQPTQTYKMICKNSQTGAKAECGTPNAVMVGMEPDKK